MKLYVIVLTTLAAGMKIPQAIHAFYAFTQAHPTATTRWSRDNNIVVLQHDDLAELSTHLEHLGLAVTRFHEPDLGDQLTAVCAEPAAGRWLSSLPLAR